MKWMRLRWKKRLPMGLSLLYTRNEQSGQELIEFAFIAPVFLALLFGIVWMGRAYNVYQTITRAAREGARYAVLPNCATCGNVYPDVYETAGSCLPGATSVFTNYVAPALAASAMDPTRVQSYCQKADWLEASIPRECGVIVSFSYPVQVVIPFTSLNYSILNITTQARMRFENTSTDATGARVCP